MSAETAPASATPQALAGGLRIENLAVSYGGNKVIIDVSLEAPLGRITGLIGPNGAGKTTIFNVCSGLLRPESGVVRLFGEEVTNRAPAIRARMGLGRTFQRMELVNAMSVRSNVALGAECRMVGSNPWRQLVSGGGDRHQILQATEEAMEICDVAHLAERTVGTLSTGQRRLVELARTLAGDFRLLLLDEPSSGLDEDETDHFGAILTDLIAKRGIGILLVEHDMPLVMAICDHIFVLDFGHLIFEGTAAQTQTNELVRAAYLGRDTTEVLA